MNEYNVELYCIRSQHSPNQCNINYLSDDFMLFNFPCVCFLHLQSYSCEPNPLFIERLKDTSLILVC